MWCRFSPLDVPDSRQALEADLRKAGVTLETLPPAMRAWAEGLHGRLQAADAERGRLVLASERVSAMLDAQSDGVASLDPAGRILHVNPAGEDMLRVAGGTLHGSSVLERFRVRSASGSENAREDARGALKLALSGVSFRDHDARLIHGPGEGTPVSLQLLPLIVGGKIQGAVLSFRDTSELKEMERAVSWSERYFRSLIEHTNDLIFLLNADGTVRYESPSVGRQLGWAPGELIGQSLLELVHPAEREPFTEIYRRSTRQAGPALLTDVRLATRSGEHLEVEASGMNLLGDPVIAGIVITARDIRERKRFESAMAAARDAALRSSSAKSMFLANMSHELRTPLNGVIGMTGLLLDSGLSSDQAEFARTAQASAESLLALIDDILDFSKIEAGRLDLEMIDFDLLQVVENIGDMLAVRAQEKGVELIYHCQGEPESTVLGDPNRLRQVLLNLLSNAVKFTPEGEIIVRSTVLEQQREKIRVRFEVRDSGIGIPPEARDRLFKSFSQVDASTTRRFGGTGLGLAISHQLVAAMGGELEVESAPGQGSSFFFTLDFPRSHRAPEASGARSVPGTVLILEENARIRAILGEYLADWGAEVLAAEPNEALLAELGRSAPADRRAELILLGHPLGGLDGAAVTRAVRRAHPGAPLVLMGALQAFLGAREPAALGADAYLSRPVKRSALRSLLSRLAGSAGPAELERPGRTATGGPTAQRPHILVVEDNVVNQRVAAKMIEQAGYRFTVASNGLEALRAFAERRFDLVLMDCHMPECDGFEATARIRELEQGALRTPIVALTADAMKGDRERCLAAGMDDYLSKPVAKAALHAVFRRYLDVPPANPGEVKAQERGAAPG